MSLAQLGPNTNVVRQRLVFEFQFAGNQTLRYDKTLTGMNLNEDQATRALLRGSNGPLAAWICGDSRITCPPLA